MKRHMRQSAAATALCVAVGAHAIDPAVKEPTEAAWHVAVKEYGKAAPVIADHVQEGIHQMASDAAHSLRSTSALPITLGDKDSCKKCVGVKDRDIMKHIEEHIDQACAKSNNVRCELWRAHPDIVRGIVAVKIQPHVQAWRFCEGKGACGEHDTLKGAVSSMTKEEMASEEGGKFYFTGMDGLDFSDDHHHGKPEAPATTEPQLAETEAEPEVIEKRILSPGFWQRVKGWFHGDHHHDDWEKGYGKGFDGDDEDEDEEDWGKGKGKGNEDDKGKGKGKGDEDGKGKGKGDEDGKGKGKGKDALALFMPQQKGVCKHCYVKTFKFVTGMAIHKVKHVCQKNEESEKKCPFLSAWCGWAGEHKMVALGMIMGYVEPWKFALGRCWHPHEGKGKGHHGHHGHREDGDWHHHDGHHHWEKHEHWKTTDATAPVQIEYHATQMVRGVPRDVVDGTAPAAPPAVEEKQQLYL